MENLILTGWGWNEYAVAAAVALRALESCGDSPPGLLGHVEMKHIMLDMNVLIALFKGDRQIADIVSTYDRVLVPTS